MKAKDFYVYDFSVPETENFICENVVAHNTLELPIDQLIKLEYNIESLKSRSVITRVETEMPADEALRTSLRLGDSAMIVGEIRSLEAKALWEAMRIGALSNVVAGTIHGESAYGVFDRVVNDLGVPVTSFKATDIISVSKMLKTADGLHRFRRLTEITEIRKKWSSDPMKEGAFVNLMEYSAKDDTLKPTDTFVNGESEVLNRIANLVKEWSGNWEAVWENINLRGRMKQTMVEMADRLDKPEILEAYWMTQSNSRFHLIADAVRRETGSADPKRIYELWLEWLKEAIQRPSIG
ncbi:MAG: Flp pilus assembly complex ATPase component TadA [Candidatus Aenigmarchaeota archaeon]|nr:Flp pilus assembly complex ATPase component TadA [Candidatus Aenigmarchaeota archaeon]